MEHVNMGALWWFFISFIARFQETTLHINDVRVGESDLRAASSCI